LNGQYNPGDVVLNKWKLTRLLGEGSHGRVFEAERDGFGQVYKAAIKIITIPQNLGEIKTVLSDGMSEENVTAYFSNFVEELIEEFALMSKLKGNSNIVNCEDNDVIAHKGSIGWDIIIRMELLTPLIDYARSRTLTRKDVMQLGIDLCKALELCQKYNIVHRDIKPENIFVSDTGDFKLGDFGIARTVEKTTSGLSKKGTYTYMAPEMYRGDPYGSNVDIYSLGIVLYRLLNENRTPFLPDYPEKITHNDKELANTKRIIGSAMPAPKNADGRLAEIVLKACAHDPKERYFSPIQLRTELEALLYNVVEKPVIYPQGDEAPLKSLGYVDDAAQVIKLNVEDDVNEPTESLLWGDIKKDFVFDPANSQQGGGFGTGEAARAHMSTHDAMSQSSDLNSTSSARNKKIITAAKIGIPIAAVLLIAAGVLGFGLLGGEDEQLYMPDTQENLSEPYSNYESEYIDYVPGDDGREFDEFGRLVGEEITDQSGAVIGLLRFTYYGDSETVSSKAEYDINGLIKVHSFFHEDGSLWHWWEASYDERENRILSERFNYEGIIESSYAFEFDGSGVLVSRSNNWFDEDGIQIRAEVYEFFENGEIHQKNYIEFFDDDVEIVRELREFDESGGMIMQIAFDYDGRAEMLEFDAFGNATQQTTFDSYGEQEHRIENEYNEEGTLLLSVREFNDADIRTRMTEYTYNDAGVLTRRRVREFNRNGSVRSTRYYRHDNHGDWVLIEDAPRTQPTPRARPVPRAQPAPPSTQPETVSQPPPAETPVTPQGCQDSRHGQGSLRPISREYNDRNMVIRETFQYFCGCRYDRIYVRNEAGAITGTYRRNH